MRQQFVVTRDTAFWVSTIRRAMGQRVSSTIRVGRLLNEAKRKLKHGEWLPMLDKLGLNRRTAQIWMRVALNPRFSNTSPDSRLPACVTTLNIISRLSDADYRQLLAAGMINPSVTRRTIAAIIRRLEQKRDEKRVADLVLATGRYRTLVIDPPWETGGGRDCPYATMSQPELLNLPVPQWLHDDAHVYLWTLDAELRNAFDLFDHWGITFAQVLTWNKTYSDGKIRMGMGANFRKTTERILFGVRGRLRTRAGARSLPDGFEAPVVAGHSVKPSLFYEVVKVASYPQYGEVFQREPRRDFVSLHCLSSALRPAAMVA
jgi:N6-adenosine-specific RNA methylase IME4